MYIDIRTKKHEQQRVEEIKEVVRKEISMMKASHDASSDQLKLIDAIQRLGLSYHYEREMDEALKHIYETYHNHDEDLYDASLRFRLLRQHGYKVSSDIFNKFKDKSGNFKECLIIDVPGMLSFYEASHLRLHGEDILDEALVFTTTHLEFVATTQKDHPFSPQITRALKWPLRKSLERLHARDYIPIYENEPSHNKALLELAKLDFNLLQSLHQKELCEIVRWWKDLDLTNKLPFARDRIVELYFWMLGVFFEPQWDINCTNQLPKYMKQYYQIFLTVYREMEEELVNEERYRVYYAKEAMKNVVRAYFDEAKWLRLGHIPTMEEYLHVASVSCAYPSLIVTSLVGMEDIETKKIFEWLLNNPKVVRASTLICRLMDDLSSRKFEQEREHIASCVECYMKQYGVSEREACDELNKVVVNAWKDINEELLTPTTDPLMPILKRILNFSKVMDFLYKDDDGYTRVRKEVKDGISALLIDAISD
ncbi:Squalene/phytoene synthase [Trema orientale]|uniref:Squalene/phytoene synthase n=1 Tax=Trema orientale TaxID=63057 RepID=A0A2P5DQ93_TREOI|nr:Squalene/phytoene synthase [Trema orientale]